MIPYILMALPCYNEAKNIPALMENFDKLNAIYGLLVETKVLIIDDCSKDETPEVVQKLNCRTSFEYVRHEKNGSLRGGIITAFNAFEKNRTSEYPAIAYGLMDGDNSHMPTNISQMLPLIVEGYDIVVASRYREGSRIMGVVWWRQVLSAFLGMMFKCMKNIPGVRDYSCGYRLYSPSIVNKVITRFGPEVVKDTSFACMVEILVKCHNLGAICTEVPFLLRYDQKLGESKMPFIQTILGNFKILLATRRVLQ